MATDDSLVPHRENKRGAGNGQSVSPADLSHLWKPGQSGGKKSPGLMRLVRRATKDGQKLVSLAMSVLEAHPIIDAALDKESGQWVQGARFPTFAERWEALKWLAERGYGRVTPVIEMPDGDVGGLMIVFRTRPEGYDPVRDGPVTLAEDERPRPALPPRQGRDGA